MPTECNPVSMRFARLKGRDVVADFGGGTMTSDAGALLLGATDRAIGLVERFAGCFSDGRCADRVVHDVAVLVGQRVFGIALGYEDLIDHDELRHDPVLGAVLGRLEARRRDCAPLALGGHDVPEADARRRFVRSHASLPSAMAGADLTLLYDNTDPDRPHREVAILGEGTRWIAESVPGWATAALARS